MNGIRYLIAVANAEAALATGYEAEINAGVAVGAAESAASHARAAGDDEVSQVAEVSSALVTRAATSFHEAFEATALGFINYLDVAEALDAAEADPGAAEADPGV